MIADWQPKSEVEMLLYSDFSKSNVGMARAVAIVIAIFALTTVNAQPLPQVVELAELNAVGSLDGITFTGSSAFENLGAGISGIGDINADGFADIAIGSPASDPNGNDSGAVYVLFGRQGTFPETLLPGDFDGTLGLVINGVDANFFSGREVAAAGDINGDGIDDLALSAPLAFTGTFSGAGETYVIFGRDDAGFPATIELSDLNGTGPNATPGITIRGAAAIDQSGFSIDAGGDINNDGVDDLLIGVANADIETGGSNRGQVIILYGQDDGSLPAIVELMDLNGVGANAAAGVRINGFNDNERIGGRVRGVGDVNGDAIDDILIANSTNSQSEFFNYLVYGSATLPDAIDLAELNGSGMQAVTGATIVCAHPCFESVGAVGDFNADGVKDFAIGETFASINGISSGRASIVFGSSNLPASIHLAELNGSSMTATSGVQVNGAAMFDFAGNAISPAGDFNGDGFDDVLVAASRGDTSLTESGISYVLFGGPPNAGQQVIELSQFDQPGVDAVNGMQMNGVMVQDRSGEQVNAAGDLNGDGREDLLISTINADRNGLDDAGEAYVVFGIPSLDIAVTKSNQKIYVTPDESTTYDISVQNLTPVAVEAVTVTDLLPATLDRKTASWICTADATSACSINSGTGDIQTSVDLGVFGQVLIELTVTAIADESETVLNTVSVALPDGLADRNPTNNQSTDIDIVALFADSFETE